MCFGTLTVSSQTPNFHKLLSLDDPVITMEQEMTSDSNYVNVGWYHPGQINSTPNLYDRAYLMKIDAQFQSMWAKTYVHLAELNAYDKIEMHALDIREISGGDFIICGGIRYNGPVPTHNAYLMKTDANGNVIWFKTYFFDGRLTSVVETTNGGFAACGYIDLPNGNEEARLIRTDNIGNLIWIKTITQSYGPGQQSAYRDMLYYAPDIYVAAGNINTTLDSCGIYTTSDYLVTVIDETTGGSGIYSFSLGQISNQQFNNVSEFANTITRNGQGNLIIGGHVVNSNFTNPCGNLVTQNATITKIDMLGNILFTYQYDINGDDMGRDIIVNSLFNEYVLVGGTEDEAFMLGVDPSGNSTFLERYQYLPISIATSVEEDFNGRYMFVGNTPGLDMVNNDVYLVERNPARDTACYDLIAQPIRSALPLPKFFPDEVDLNLIQGNMPIIAVSIPVIDSILCDTIQTPCLPPIAVDDSALICSDTIHCLAVLPNDMCINSCTIRVVTPPMNGVVTSIDQVNGAICYDPNTGFIGTDVLAYELCDACGCDTTSIFINVEGLPTTSFTWSVSGQKATFTNTSTGSYHTVLWYYGDNIGSFAYSPSHTYSDVGDYEVCLTMYSDCGSTTYCDTITIPCPSDIYESNDTLADAYSVSLPFASGKNAWLCDGDEDWFEFYGNKFKKKVKAKLQGLPENYDLEMYTASGTLLTSSTNSGTTDETITYTLSENGYYYIRVFAPDGDFSRDYYSLTINAYAVVPPESIKNPFSLSSLLSVRLPYTSTGEVDDLVNITSIDAYPNPADDKVDLRIESSINQDIQIKLVDMYGRSIISETHPVSEGRLNLIHVNTQNIAAGTYIIHVMGSDWKGTGKLIITH